MRLQRLTSDNIARGVSYVAKLGGGFFFPERCVFKILLERLVVRGVFSEQFYCQKKTWMVTVLYITQIGRIFSNSVDG
jgi:hypothetical protein